MGWQIKAGITGKTGRKTTIHLPIGDNDMAQILQKIRMEPMDTKVTITDIEPQELASLCGESRDLDELNYLAKRMDGLWKPEMDKFRAMMEANLPESIGAAINDICNLGCYSLIDERKSLSDIGRDFIMDRDGSMLNEEYDNGDFSDTGRKLLDSGEGRKTSYGTLYSTGNDYYIDYKSTTFPEYCYESSVFNIWLDYGDNEEIIQLPCDDLTIDKAVRRLGAESLDDCKIAIADCWPVSYDWLEKLCPDLEAADIREVNRFAGMCRNFEDNDYRKIDGAMDYSKVSGLDAAITIAQNIDAFRFVPSVTDERSLGEYIIHNSLRYYYDESLEDYIDFERFGRDIIAEENGLFIENKGYVGLLQGYTLDEIIDQDEDSGMTMQ